MALDGARRRHYLFHRLPPRKSTRAPYDQGVLPERGDHVARLRPPSPRGTTYANARSSILRSGHHRVVLHGGGHHVVARAEDPLDRLIESDGRVFRKNEAGAVGAPEQFREALPRDEQVAGGADGEDVPGATGVPGPQDGVPDGLRHAGRLGKRGCRVVEVYVRDGTGRSGSAGGRERGLVEGCAFSPVPVRRGRP